MRTLASALSATFTALENCRIYENPEWAPRWEAKLDFIERNYLPRGSGIDNGTKIDREKSTTNKLVLTFGFHHMDSNGSYDGWTDYVATVTPSFDGINVTIRGRNRSRRSLTASDYLHDVYRDALSRPWTEPVEATTPRGGTSCGICNSDDHDTQRCALPLPAN